MHIAENWRMEDARYSLKGKAELTSDQRRLLLAMHVPSSALLGMSAEQLQEQYPLAFQIPEIAQQPEPDVQEVRSLRRKIEHLPEAFRDAVYMLAVAMIATL